MSSPNILPLVSFFQSAYALFNQHRKAFFLLLALVFGLLAYLASRIQFEEDITRLVPADAESQRVTEVLQATQFADKIIINIRGEHPGNLEILQRYADEVGAALTAPDMAPYVAHVQVQLPAEQLGGLLEVVGRHLPLFLDETDYLRIDSLTQPEALAKRVETTYQAMVSPSGFIGTAQLRQDPLGLSFMGLQKFEQLQSGDAFSLRDGYLVHKNLQNLLVMVTPALGSNETGKNTEFVAALDGVLATLNEVHLGQAHAEYVGAMAVAVANAKQIKRDIQVTLTVALLLLIALFIYFYRKAHIPLIILVPAAFGSLLGIVVLYLIKGTISAISIGIGSVLLGLTLDYSLHILSHYRSTGDIKQLFHAVTKPLAVCAVFTAVDFLCLLFLHSDVLHDLGIFAAVSVLGAGFMALIFIPQAYTPNREVTVRQNTLVDSLSRYDASTNKYVLGGCALLIVASAFTYHRVSFDNDIGALNYHPQHLQEAEQRLQALSNQFGKTLYLVSYGDTYDDALATNTALFDRLSEVTAGDTTLAFSSLGGVIQSQSQQAERIARWEDFWSAERRQRVEELLIREGQRYGFREHTFQPFFALLSANYEPAALQDEEAVLALMLADFAHSEPGLTTVTTMVRTGGVDTDSIIQALQLEGQNVLPIDRKHMQESFLLNLEKDFNTLFFISGIAVFVVLFLFYGSIELTLITNIPIFLGWFITLGMMGMFGVSFNAFNIIITTLIFGLGVDYSIFVTKGLLEQYTYGRKDMPAFKSGIIMSALATLLCFGVLAFAQHPAIRSISTIPLIGLVVVVLMSFTVQPWLFRTFILGRQERGRRPWRLSNLLLSIYTFGYFFLGAILVSTLPRLVLLILPISRQRKKRWFHHSIRWFYKGLVYSVPFTRKRIFGKAHLQDPAPAIIIANHTSELDTPSVGMLKPNSVFVVNQRVITSKFFGAGIRAAGFRTLSGDDEQAVAELKQQVAEGYSVIIFPEGTRSPNAEIGRFHKGAFFLAEKLDIDILPVLVHGNTDLLPRRDFMVMTGSMTFRVLPRIKPDDRRMGEGYRARTKAISRYFKEEFRKLRDEMETPAYHRGKLMANFVYKDRAIQREVKSIYRARAAAYLALARQLPRDAHILHLGCGYGILDFMLVYDAAHRRIDAWDADSEKVQVARHTYTSTQYGLNFAEDCPTFGPRHHVLILSGNPSYGNAAAGTRPDWLALDDGDDAAARPWIDRGEYQLVFEYENIRLYQACRNMTSSSSEVD